MPPRFRREPGREKSAERVSGRFGASGSFEMRQLILRFLSDQSGATAIEYCLIACGIALTIIGIVQAIGPQLSTIFSSVNSSLK
jgi:pilus assembly protein Flp/PilA